jgi:FkbM family methyltransferase
MNFISKLILEALPPSETLSIIDCGARGGTEANKWAPLADRVTIYGFEPDEAECAKLNSNAQARGLQHFYFPVCLAQQDEQKHKFFKLKQGDSSSLYQPNECQISRWKQFIGGNFIYTKANFVLDKVIEIPTTSLDTWADANNIKGVDFIKLDVQGAELDILKGGRKLLQNILGIETEVEFVPLYINQPLFAEVDIFLRQQGFTFFQFHFTHKGHFVGRIASPINIMHQGDSTFLRQIKGQLVTADAIYLWDPIEHQDKNMRDLSVKNILKLACISEVSGQVEYAFELLVWLQNLLTKAGEKHDAEVPKEIYLQAADLYKNQQGFSKNHDCRRSSYLANQTIRVC